MKRKPLLMIAICLLAFVGMMNAQSTNLKDLPEGAIDGLFSVEESTRVYFSQGNLQYQASTNSWKFAENQWNYVGSDNTNISETYSGWIDLFGWGTSGYDHGANSYQPWSTSTNYKNYYAYGSDTCNLYDQTGQADWGYNAISNGGNTENSGWRALTQAEWDYVFNTRTTTSGIRYAKANVNNINGVILLPDDWQTSYYSLNNTNDKTAEFSSNTITAENWSTLEQHGAVFLPAAGNRYGTEVSDVGSSGYYWSSSYSDKYNVRIVQFYDSDLHTNDHYGRQDGLSVRLVRSLPKYTVTVNPVPTEGGEVIGGGTYETGTECTVMADASLGYTFVYWTEGGRVISSEPSYTFTVDANRNLEANFIDHHSAGNLNGAFLVGENTKVYFSQGNLQYKASTNSWIFAVNQWDYVGSDNTNISETYSGWIDLFGWGTSGYNHGAICYQPWSTSTEYGDYLAYGNDAYNLYDQTGQADWGYNAIINGENTTNIWRSLTGDEWDYVFNTRSTSSGIRYAKANVNGVNGVILLPDGWQASYYSLNSTNTSDAGFSTNTITCEQWSTLEQHGAVFLPAAGYRNGTTVWEACWGGSYWSSSYYEYTNERYAYFDNTFLGNGYGSRYDGYSVRLVRLLRNYSVTASPNPAEGGTVSGGGTCEEGSDCTLTATPSEGYTFAYWTEAGRVVSSEACYTFEVHGNRNLVANFSKDASTGKLTGAFSVGENTGVCFSQGNLQYQASTNIWRFAENQWDYVGDGNANISETYNGLIDLFGWGTSGYDHGAICYQPYSTSTSYSDYWAYEGGYSLNDQTGQADWGYNAIINGGNTENSGWRTLTHDEWEYLINTRSTSSGIRYAKAIVNNIYGAILLPDDWQASYYSLNSPNTSEASNSTNTISAEDWSILEQHGAVFLPSAGERLGTLVSAANLIGYYWSSSYVTIYNASNFFCGSGLYTSQSIFHHGQSVRLVRPLPSYSVTASPVPSEGGTVSGAGTYYEGEHCTLTATASAGYAFVNWTENGQVVSSEASYTFAVDGDKDLVANFTKDWPGAICGVFSVGSNTGVFFSQGNMQYQASTNTWRFAENQWDYVANDNANASSTYSGWIDLFGWGTSGYNHGANCYQPWSTSTNYEDYRAYGDGGYNLYDQTGQADWGYNAISNGGNTANSGWHTLTYEEWNYVFNNRSTSSGILFAKARVNNICGVILLPDDWQASYYSLNGVNEKAANFSANTIGATQWSTLEQHGAVFLPAVGRRDGTSVIDIGSNGNYWSTSCSDGGSARYLSFSSWVLYAYESQNRSSGLSVRLVRSLQKYSVTASPNSAEGGTVSGGGNYYEGAKCTLTATASEGYTFVNWTDNGHVVSTEATCSFVVIGNRDLVANFESNTTVYNKSITGYNNGGGWYLIASPIGVVNPQNVTDMLSNSYDLYSFDQSQAKEWLNYKGDAALNYAGGFDLEPGKGYLYANSADVTLSFSGITYTGTGEVTLTYDADANLKGWNLIGNPFAETAYIGDRAFYVMNGEGSEIVAAETNAIAAMEGVFVVAETDGETVTFSTTAPVNTGSKLALNISQNRGTIDRAIVRFDEGQALPKFQLRETSTKVYIPVDGKDYAVVRGNNEGELPVSFKAEHNGSYTISVEAENIDMEYLHLVDNMTGADIDLLAQPSYSFEARTTDYESRFKLVFATCNSNEGDNIGFINGMGNLVIFGNEGEATLQVIDILGHVLISETFSGSYNKHLDVSPGVYMLRVIDGQGHSLCGKLVVN